MRDEIGQKIFDALKMLAIIKRTDVSIECIHLMTKILSKFDFERVKKLIDHHALRSKYFPDISEFINELDPLPSEKDLAIEITGKIVESISRFGYVGYEDAKKYVGETAWDAVVAAGGWNVLCNSNESNLSTLKAQIREHLCSKIKNEPELKSSLLPKSKISLLDHKLQSEEKNGNQVKRNQTPIN